MHNSASLEPVSTAAPIGCLSSYNLGHLPDTSTHVTFYITQQETIKERQIPLFRRPRDRVLSAHPNSGNGTHFEKSCCKALLHVTEVHPRTGHEGPDGEYRYSSTLSLNSALSSGGWLTPRSCRFTPGKETRYP